VRDDGRTYWHIVLELREPHDAVLALPRRNERLSLAKFALPLPS
jgi:hypothetical protein